MEASHPAPVTTDTVTISASKVDVTMANPPAAKGKSGGGGNGESLKYLLGGAAVLQTVLTAIGVSSGGVSALAVNHRGFVIGGFASVIASIAIAAIVLALDIGKEDSGKVLTVIGTLLLFGGIFVTAYAALVAPGIAKTPNINIALSESPTKELDVTAHVTASGIKENTPYWLEVDAREYQKEAQGGHYIPIETPLYQNQLGADSKGDINSIVTIQIPEAKYKVISVEAWNGAHAGPCGSLETEGGANLTQLPKEAEAKKQAEKQLSDIARAGCVVVRLPR
jgi:hypothetical protein